MKEGGIDVKIPKEIIVPACRECNLLVSNNCFETFSEKKKFIQNAIRKRYAKILNSPNWSDEEIIELEGDLRRMIYFNKKLKEAIKARVNY